MSKISTVSKRPTRRQLLSIAAAGAVVAAGADASVAHAGASSGVSPSEYDPLVGTWLAVYQHSPGSRLWGIWTYHGDGTLVTTGSDHPTRTPSHGGWRNLGNNQYQSSVIGVNVDSTGNTTGFTTVDTDFTLDSSGPPEQYLAGGVLRCRRRLDPRGGLEGNGDPFSIRPSQRPHAAGPQHASASLRSQGSSAAGKRGAPCVDTGLASRGVTLAAKIVLIRLPNHYVLRGGRRAARRV
jgi:hypothetical protein